jgi:hypothetical protein
LVKRLGRSGFHRLMQEVPVRGEVVREACGGHCWGRFLPGLG